MYTDACVCKGCSSGTATQSERCGGLQAVLGLRVGRAVAQDGLQTEYLTPFVAHVSMGTGTRFRYRLPAWAVGCAALPPIRSCGCP